MANNGHQASREYRRRPRQKENVLPTAYHSIISDEEALKIHGLNNSYSTDSDSGKSNFDEEYFKNKPEPFQINRTNTVIVKKLNSKNDQPQTKKYYVHNAKINKGFSTPPSGKHGSNSTSFKRNSNKQKIPRFKHFQTDTPLVHPNIDKFVAIENNFQNLQDITCQSSSTNHSITKYPQKNPNVSQLSTKIEDNSRLTAENLDKIVRQNNRPKTSSETAFQNDIRPVYRNIRDGSVNDGTQSEQAVHNVPYISGQIKRNATPTHKSTQGTAHSLNYTQPLMLNVSDLPNVITKVPKPTSNSNTINSLTSHTVTNSSMSQNVQATSNRYVSCSPRRESQRQLLDERRISEEPSEMADLREEMNRSCCTSCIDFLLCNN